MKRELVTGLLTLSLLASMLPANAQAAEGMFGASAAGQVQTMTEGAGEDGVQTENAADIDGTQKRAPPSGCSETWSWTPPAWSTARER